MRRPAGDYIHLVTINQVDQVPSPSGNGQLVETTTAVCSAFARIETPRGNAVQLPEGQQVQSINTVILCVPYTQQTIKIKTTHKLTKWGEIYEVVAARDITGRREEIQIDCLESVQ